MFKLFQGDCFDEMKKIETGSVDMVLTDPPYGTTRNSWDNIIDPAKMMSEFRRIVKPSGAILIFSQLPFTCDVIEAWPKGYRYSWIYEKGSAQGWLNANKMPLRAYEIVSVFYSKLPTYNPQYTDGKPLLCKKQSNARTKNYDHFKPIDYVNEDGKRYPRDVLHWHTQERGLCSTQKPVDLLEYFIRTYTDSGQTVLDACMGSGSTAIAAYRTGREFIGIEKDADMFQIARHRVATETNQHEAYMLKQLPPCVSLTQFYRAGGIDDRC